MSSPSRGEKDAKADDKSMVAATRSTINNENDSELKASNVQAAASRSRFNFHIPNLFKATSGQTAVKSTSTISQSPSEAFTPRDNREPAGTTSNSTSPGKGLQSPLRAARKEGPDSPEAQKENLDESPKVAGDEAANMPQPAATKSTLNSTASSSKGPEGQAAASKPKFSFNIPTLSKATAHKLASNNPASDDARRTGALPPQARSFSNWKLEQSPPLSARSESAAQIQSSKGSLASQVEGKLAGALQARGVTNGKLLASPPLSARSESAIPSLMLKSSSSRDSLPATQSKSFSNLKAEQSPPLSARSESASQLLNSPSILTPNSSRASLTAQGDGRAALQGKVFSNLRLDQSPPLSARSETQPQPANASCSPEVLSPNSSKASLNAHLEGKHAGAVSQAKSLPNLRLAQSPPLSSRSFDAQGEDFERIVTWQNDVFSMEESQLHIQAGQMKLLHSQLHIVTRELGQLQKQVAGLSQSVSDGNTNFEEVELQLRIDLQKVRNELSKNIAAVNDEHQEKHAEIADAFETGLKVALEQLHGELSDLRSSIGSSASLRSTLGNVSQQVEAMASSMEKERDLRKTAEAKFDKMSEEWQSAFQEQQKIVSEWHRDLDSVVNDCASWKIELMQHLKKESEMKATTEDALKSMSDQHHETHALNAEKLEAGLQNVLKSTHAKLQEELQVLKSSGIDNQEDLRRQVNDATEQVDNLRQATGDLQIAVEAKIDNMLSVQDTVISELRKDVQVAVNESHEALKLEIAEHGRIDDQVIAVVEEGNLGLKGELQQLLSTLREELAVHVKSTEEKHSSIEDVLKAMNDQHHEIHESNKEKIEAGQHALGSTHAKLQDELQFLKSGQSGVTQQLQFLEQVASNEHDLRMGMEVKVEKLLSAQDKLVAELREDMQSTVNASLAALTSELGEFRRNSDKVRAAVAEGHITLKGECFKEMANVLTEVTQRVDSSEQAVGAKMEKILSEQDKLFLAVKKDVMVAVEESHAALKKELGKHGTSNDRIKDEMDLLTQTIGPIKRQGEQISKLEAQLYDDLKKALDGHKDMVRRLDEDHREKQRVQAQNLEALASDVQSLVANTFNDLQQDFKELRSSCTENHGSLQERLTNVTEKVESFTTALDKGHNQHKVSQEALDKLCGDLRRENAATLTEAHTSLHAELVVQVNAKLADLERQLRNDIKKTSNDSEACQRLLQGMSAKQAAKYLVYDQRLLALESFGCDKKAPDREPDQMSAKIQELLDNLQQQVSKTVDVCRASLEERSQVLQRQLNEQLRESIEPQIAMQGKVQLAAQEQTLATIESRVSHVERVFTETSEKLQKEVEGVHAKFCEALSMFNNQRCSHENNKAIVEQRLATLQRAVGDASDSHTQAVRDCRTELSKELAQLAKSERTSREALEHSFVDYVQEARAQNRKLETKIGSFLALNQSGESPPRSPSPDTLKTTARGLFDSSRGASVKISPPMVLRDSVSAGSIKISPFMSNRESRPGSVKISPPPGQRDSRGGGGGASLEISVADYLQETKPQDRKLELKIWPFLSQSQHGGAPESPQRCSSPDSLKPPIARPVVQREHSRGGSGSVKVSPPPAHRDSFSPSSVPSAHRDSLSLSSIRVAPPAVIRDSRGGSLALPSQLRVSGGSASPKMGSPKRDPVSCPTQTRTIRPGSLKLSSVGL